MANSKISALTAATTPLAGTEVLPVVQSGVTKQVSVANLTAGRAVSADSLTLTGSPLPATSGGTGQSSYAVGDLLYASTTTALSKLADVATGNALISGGVGVSPSWGKIGLTTHVSGTLPTANGGTNLTSFTSGGVLYASSTSALTTGSALQFNGKVQGVGAAPSTWYTTYNGLQINTVGGITSNTDFFAFSDNVLVDGSANETFLTNGYAMRYRQVASSGKHEWYATAASGTAGNAATLNLLLDLSPSSGDLGLKTGNIVPATAAKGINFTANSALAGKTSQLLNWYEEGTYTATLTPGTSGTITLNSSYDTLAYTRVGRLVTITGQIQVFSVSSPVGTYFYLNLPFTPADLTELAGRGGFMLNYQYAAVAASWEEGTSNLYIWKSAATVASPDNLFISFSYFTS